MQASELNLLIAALTNHFHTTLKHDDFINLGIFLSLLSKDILAMEIVEDLCKWEEKHKEKKES